MSNTRTVEVLHLPSTRHGASRYTQPHSPHRPAAGHGRNEGERSTALLPSSDGRHQSSRWNNILSGDFLRETSATVSCSSFLAREMRREAMDRNGRRSLASQCRVAGARRPVDPSTRSLPKVFFFFFLPVWEGKNMKEW